MTRPGESMTPTQQAVAKAFDDAWERQGKPRHLDPHDDRVIAIARLFRNYLVGRAQDGPAHAPAVDRGGDGRHAHRHRGNGAH